MFNQKTYYTFKDVLIKPRVSNINSRSEVDLTSKITDDWNPIPIMSSNMDTITGTELAFELLKRNWIAVLHKYVSSNEITKLFDDIEIYNKNNENKINTKNLFISRGTTQTDKEKLQERIDQEPRISSICIDVANGCRTDVFKYIEELRNGSCKDKILMVGNIASGDVAIEYAKRGVDILKCGIGEGAACLTRVKTGVGVPQISMINEIKLILDSSIQNNFNLSEEEFKNIKKAKICSDGGCTNPGDVSKAFVAGADFVMLGGMLSGHKECPGTLDEIDGKKFKRFSGMAAKESQWNGVPDHGTEEGKTVMIPYKGKIYHTLDDIEGGIRSTCTYTNSSSISDLYKAELIIASIQENKTLN